MFPAWKSYIANNILFEEGRGAQEGITHPQISAEIPDSSWVCYVTNVDEHACPSTQPHPIYI